MKRIFADAETYYDKEYSLRKMTPVEYILDHRFESQIWTVTQDDDEKVDVLIGDDVEGYLNGIDEPYMFISHNSLFDATILSLRYDIHPFMLIDSMGMANALLRHVLPGGHVNLGEVGKFLGIGHKTGFLPKVMGKRLEEIRADPNLWIPFCEYGVQDTRICRGIYNNLKSKFPASEHVIMDIVLKMATRPQFLCDKPKLYAHLHNVITAKAELLARVGLEKEDLRSDAKLAEILRGFGVEPPTKTSPITNKTAYAFAKTDKAFTDLEDHENLMVQAIVSARLGSKSTLEESRTQRLINIAEATEDRYGVPILPVPLRFSGAHTHRLSGDWKINLQNLPSRGNTEIRSSLTCEPGYVVLAVDASQIEARLTAWLSGQWNLVEAFRRLEDIYSQFASDIYGRKVTKADKIERLLGKICILALGFGMGPPKLKASVRIQALAAGYDIQITDDEAYRYVNLYRRKFSSIFDTWGWLKEAIPRIASGSCEGETFGPCTLHKGRIGLPSGLSLFYEDLRWSEGQWTFTYDGKRKRLYGGKLLENIVQAMDRVFVFEAAALIKREMWRSYKYDLNLAHQIHDELVYVVPQEWLEIVKGVAMKHMSTPRTWGLDLPLSAEAKAGPSYGELLPC